MMRLSRAFYNRSILSLRTGGQIGTAHLPIINPDTLKIEGWYSTTSLNKGEHILPSLEVRDFITKGLVVNDHDAITEPEDMVRLKDIINVRYELLGKTVFTESKKRLGKVVDFAVDEGFFIQKLYVNPPLFKGLSNQQLLIARDEIVEVTDKKIVVVDANITAKAGTPVKAEA